MSRFSFGGQRQDGGPRRSIAPRLIIGLVIAGMAVVGYFGRSSLNPITGKTQHIAMTVDQEIALGLQSAPEMARQFGGLADDRAAAPVKNIGAQIVASLPPEAPQYPFDYHLLADNKTVNAFALPGGQIFITNALLTRLQTPGQLAGVLGHETGHVLARHSAAQMAKQDFTRGLVNAVGAASGSYDAASIASMVGQFSLLKYGRDDELEADRLGVRLMARAGYDPKSMIDVMHILEQASGGQGRTPDFASTHPSPANRVQAIEKAIKEEFPSGLPAGLKP